MKEHPNYKYRPRRKPKNAVKAKDSTARFPYGLGSLEAGASHLNIPMIHLNESHAPSSLASFNRPPFFPVELLSTPAIDAKSPTERAEFNYSRLLFASQMPSLHLGFAAMAHPSLHPVQIPWYPYGMADPNGVFNPLHPPIAAVSGSPTSSARMQPSVCCDVDSIDNTFPSPLPREMVADERLTSPVSTSDQRPASSETTSSVDSRPVIATARTTSPPSALAAVAAVAAARTSVASSALMSGGLLSFPYKAYLPPTCAVDCRCPRGAGVANHHHHHHHISGAARPSSLSTVL